MTPPASDPDIAIVAAVARNRVIGREGGLAWRDPQDARHFRDTTMGSPVIMGRKTWDSLPAKFRPLPGRRNIVVTRNLAWHDHGAEAVPSLDAALDAAADAPRVCVVGGADLFALALPRAQLLVLTEIDADLEGDTLFPAWDRSAFEVRDRIEGIDAGGTRFAFVTYARVLPRADAAPGSAQVAPGT